MLKLTDHIAQRGRSIDFTALGFFLPNPDPVLRARGGRIELYRELRTDAHVGGCIRRRKSAVKALQWGIDRGQSPSRVAKSVEAMLADIDMERLIGEAMDAVLYGYQPMEVIWQKAGALVVPCAVIGKPPEWFHFDSDNQLRFKTRENPVQGEALPPMKFLLPRQDATYQNPYGFADLSMCFWPLLFKKGGVKFWLGFTEKFGSAFSVGKLPRGAEPQERAAMLDSLEALIQNGVATIPDDGSVELLEMAGKSASADLYERLVMYCRSEVSIALTGTNQTTEASSNKASATAGLEVADDLRDGDAEIIAAAINQMIRWTVQRNWANAKAPVFSFWDQESQDQLQAGRDKSNYEAGARFTNDYWMRAYGYQEGDLQPQAVVSPLANVAASPLVKSAAVQDTDEVPAFADPVAIISPDVAIAEQLASAAQPMMDVLIREVSKMVDRAADLGGLQRDLLNAYGDLDTDALSSLMAAAFALAELKGIDAVRSESSAEKVAFSEPALLPTGEPMSSHHLRFTADLEVPAGLFNPIFKPTINVPPAIIQVNVPEQAAPVVQIENAAPVVHVAAPVVHVAAADMPAPVIHVTMPKTSTTTQVLRDADGRINQVVQTEKEISK